MNLMQWFKNVWTGSRRPAVSIPEDSDAPVIRRRYRFFGLVQNVGFRYEAQMLASQLNLVGWAANKRDGTVLVEIEGRENRIDEFLRAMKRVPRFEITEVEEENLPLSKTETGFQIVYF